VLLLLLLLLFCFVSLTGLMPNLRFVFEKREEGSLEHGQKTHAFPTIPSSFVTVRRTLLSPLPHHVAPSANHVA